MAVEITSEIQELIDAAVQETINVSFQSLVVRINEKRGALEKLQGQVGWPESVGPKPLRDFTRVTHETYYELLRWLRELSDELNQSIVS